MSKKIYNLDDLSILLDEEISWRRKELSIIKNYIPFESNPKQNAALRFNVPILYAHFEGFVKQATEMYLNYVACKTLKHSELQSQFVTLSLTKKLGLLEIKNIEDKTKIIDFILNENDSRSNILTKNVIQTKSNLKFNVLKEVLFTIGIEVSKFENYKQLVNDLVEARNFIAHGDYLKIDYKTYINMFDDIQKLMIELKIEIENSALLENYKIKKSEV